MLDAASRLSSAPWDRSRRAAFDVEPNASRAYKRAMGWPARPRLWQATAVPGAFEAASVVSGACLRASSWML
jgi:hypothetical protein